MEIGVPNSFIPHDATTPTAARHYEGGNGLVDLIMLIAIVFFVASVALAVGSYVYLAYLNTESAAKSADLKKAESLFDQHLIDQLTKLDKRLSTANTLLNSHIAPSAFFNALNNSTLQTVSFQQLSFSDEGATIKLSMSGIARDINSVARQADEFGKDNVITNAIFSGIDQQADGVHFQVVGDVNLAAVNYESAVTGQTPTTTAAPAAPATDAATTSAPSFRGPTSQNANAAQAPATSGATQ